MERLLNASCQMFCCLVTQRTPAKFMFRELDKPSSPHRFPAWAASVRQLSSVWGAGHSGTEKSLSLHRAQRVGAEAEPPGQAWTGTWRLTLTELWHHCRATKPTWPLHVSEVVWDCLRVSLTSFFVLFYDHSFSFYFQVVFRKPIVLDLET